MILFHSCLGCAILTLHLFCIIGHPIGDLYFKPKSNKSNKLFERNVFNQENDGSSEYVDIILQTVSRDVSTVLKNSSKSDNLLFRINNIYLIGNFNASVVKVGELSFKKYLQANSNKKSQTKTSKKSECNTFEVTSTKISMPEYFNEVANTKKSTSVLNHSTKMQTTENDLEITYHHPARTTV